MVHLLDEVDVCHYNDRIGFSCSLAASCTRMSQKNCSSPRHLVVKFALQPSDFVVQQVHEIFKGAHPGLKAHERNRGCNGGE